jgi:hypothetical protein
MDDEKIVTLQVIRSIREPQLKSVLNTPSLTLDLDSQTTSSVTSPCDQSIEKKHSCYTMAVARRCSNEDGRVDTSLRNAARAILDLAQPHGQREYNDRQRRPEYKSVVKREPMHHRRGTSMRRYRVVVRRPSVVPVAPQPFLPLEFNNATVIPNDDEVDPEEEDAHHHCLQELESNQKNGSSCCSGSSSNNNFPPIQFRNYSHESKGSHNTCDIGNIASCPMVGKPLSLPPRLPYVRCTNVVGIQFGTSLSLSQPPSLIKLPKTIEFPRRIKN